MNVIKKVIKDQQDNEDETDSVIYCHNCGELGHINTECTKPITSYGIILYYPLSDETILQENPLLQAWTNEIVDSCDHETTTKIQYLMIMDRHTPDYAQIIIGNYELEDLAYLRRLIGRVTETEANLMLSQNFRDLFTKYWIYTKKDATKIYHKQYGRAEYLFNKLRYGITVNGQTVTWKSLLAETEPHWLDPDWGFPKGRRKRRKSESDMDCAMREFEEETSITPDLYNILHHVEPIEENIKGSNGINYRTIYFLAEAKTFIPVFTDPNNKTQSSEIGKIGWYDYQTVRKLIRPYQHSRLKIIHRIHKYLGNLTHYM